MTADFYRDAGATGDAPTAGTEESRLRTAELFAVLHDPGADVVTSRAAREGLVHLHLALVQHCARRFLNRGELQEDLVQVGTIGLLKAIDRFDAGRGVEFSTYATPTIIGEIKRHFRDRGWAIRVPRRLQELRLAITEANSTLTHTLGRSPTVPDIAVHLGISEEDVLEGLEGARAYNATSLSTPISSDGSTELGDTLGGEDREYEIAETRVALGPALASLDEREQKILTLRFYGNLTQSQIADQVGISQMHVSRLLTRALTKLRGQLSAA
jgi:RNA polymerase sigma-B factor